ncbi:MULTISPECIES: winged helix-turn-helix domain-containing protein [Sphingobium]|uniref:Winged helix-turn-helix domain-containing protein n=1 Tax=Sphingobium fuliginis ATCC 27551 TaxID=1208342 RepID=A0A5B8CJI7_SPHSA|nr:MULTISPECIES: crosslink repair DNA glycosylase YcaQ family protein [Sphingobium]OAP32269.1 cytoplasmic protein [Sphingobium sp. 20006FA]AJR25322.1 cytoplasmic protein [Sphingobium sp. YBL2]KXU33057.1 cytoplasmic protein [Sphingobium sp. AM]KYC33943.1 cytoplasmic protein [Sphingobium sp. 22B]QDC36891.1 winged helix-turn-helix domain-containing protein [Sphingobium fuliginis ATCC 27551]
MTNSISLREARRIALAAQGFGRSRPTNVGKAHLRRTTERLGLHQIDSVNVLARAHYMPAYSRLGGYDPGWLDQAAWGKARDRRLFEYWAHEASLLPMDYHPLLRWRMTRADRGETGWKGLRLFAGERRIEAEALLARFWSDGPLAASDFEGSRNRSGWWEWGEAKQMLEWLFWAGHITTATRRGSFERVYDLTERVIPPDILGIPTPEPRDAQRALIERSARALGIATAGDLRDYFRLKPDEARDAIQDLKDEGTLIPVLVDGISQAVFLHRDAQAPRRIAARALLSPFDPLIWERSRTEKLFDFHYRIGIYTPAHKRSHGYYDLAFLLGDRIVARTDLKADRKTGRLLVQSVHLELGAPAETHEELAAELRFLAQWLKLEPVLPEI